MYNAIVFQPLYNGLVGIIDLLPWADVGVAVIIFTVIIRLILFPLSKSSLITQVRMKEIEPEANKIKAQYASDKQMQAVKTMELYKAKGVHPFSGVLLLIIQLPILLALISVFYKIIPTIDKTLLYPLILTHLPAVISPTLFGFDLTTKSLFLSLLVAVSQFVQLNFSIAARQQKAQNALKPKNAGPGDMSTQLASSMTTQMKYILPLLAFVSTYWIIPAKFPQAASIIAIYWSVSALFTLGQELYIRKRHLENKI